MYTVIVLFVSNSTTVASTCELNFFQCVNHGRVASICCLNSVLSEREDCDDNAIGGSATVGSVKNGSWNRVAKLTDRLVTLIYISIQIVLLLWIISVLS